MKPIVAILSALIASAVARSVGWRISRELNLIHQPRGVKREAGILDSVD